jgi:hypothetical protein
VRSFLVETYVADDPSAHAEVREQAVRAAALAGDVRLVRTTFLPSDEVALHVFEAPSAEAVERAATRAGLRYDRLVDAHEEIETTPLPPGGEPKEDA